MPPPPEEPQTLDYGNHPPLAWVGRNRRKLILLALLGAMIGPVVWYWPQIRYRVLWVYWSKQAAAYQTTPNLPLAAALDNLVQPAPPLDPGYLTVEGPADSPTRIIHTPRPVRELAMLDPRLLGLQRAGIAFVGTMHRPDGTPRLVIINNSQDARSYRVDSTGRVMAPPPTAPNFIVLSMPGWFDPIPPVTVAVAGGPQFLGRVMTGKLDPNDPSHLILNLDTPRQGTLHLYLQNDDSFRDEQDLVRTPDQIIRNRTSRETQ